MERNNSENRNIQMSATPIAVGELWSRKENHIPGLLSLLAHVSAITALIVLSVATTTKPRHVEDSSILLEPIAMSLALTAKPGGGGGGGTHSPTPASRGILPRAADKQFVPPTPLTKNLAPELIMEPTIVALELTNLLRPTGILQLGDPHGVQGPPSSGKGTGGGIGDEGDGRGVGPGTGPGAGPGCCGGTGGNDAPPGLHVGTVGVSPPSCPVQVEPNYSDDARKARVQGVVLLAVTIQKDGSIETNKVLQGLGYGLDDEAKKVLNKWKCNPGKYNGQAVALPIQIQINFHLY